MNSLPVIGRELRSEARNAQNYWLRVVAAGVMVVAAALGYLSLIGSVGGKGWELFGILQPTLYTLIWLLVPIMTCDCISRERREGTLGLLFLTPLRPIDVLLAKATSSVLRAFSLLLAAGPVIVLMLLLGGVSNGDLLRAAMMNLMALLGAIAAGLMASGCCRSFKRAALLAVLLAFLFMLILGGAPSVHLILWVLASGAAPAESLSTGELVMMATIFSWMLNSGVAGVWTVPPMATNPTQLWLALGQTAGALLLLLLAMWIVSRRLRIGLVETGLTVRQANWRRILCTPRLFTGVFRRWNTRQLDRNPVGWLQRRTWSARVSMWGWMTALIVIELGLLEIVSFRGRAGSWEQFSVMQPILAGLLGLGISFSAADSLREERETGGLELLLVTPLTVRKVIAGRLFGLWGQYLPSMLAILAAWLYVISWSPVASAGPLAAVRYGFAAVLISSYLAVPVIGLNQSLHRGNFLSAWMATLGLGLIGPLVVPMTLFDGWSWSWQLLTGRRSYIPYQVVAIVAVLIVGAQLVLARRAARRVAHNLNSRQFALGK